MKNAVFYKGYWLATGSKAHQLYTDKEFQKLDQHLRELDIAERKRRGEL